MYGCWAVIDFERVTKTYPGPDGRPAKAVEDLCLTVSEGELVCLIGTSGCGKSTTLKLVNRMIEASAGEVRVGGVPVAEQDPVRLRRRIGYVMQAGGLFPHLTVGENLCLLPRVEGWPRAKARARVDELLDLVGLEPQVFATRYPDELSGGERQRVGVARALVLDPEIVLMDEPFGALDPITRKQLHADFTELENILKKTVLFVTHDLREAFLLGDRVALMDAGRLVQVGSEAALLTQPATPFVQDFLRDYVEQRDAS